MISLLQTPCPVRARDRRPSASPYTRRRRSAESQERRQDRSCRTGARDGSSNDALRRVSAPPSRGASLATPLGPPTRAEEAKPQASSGAGRHRCSFAPGDLRKNPSHGPFPHAPSASGITSPRAALFALAASWHALRRRLSPAPDAVGVSSRRPIPSRRASSLHVTMTSGALKGALDDAVPRSGDGTFALLGGQRRYTWDRAPLDLGFSQGRITLETTVQASLAIPLHTVTFPLAVRVLAEPIVSGEYAVKLQSVEVKVTSPDQRLAIADAAAHVYDQLAASLTAQLHAFTYDLRPLLAEAELRIAQPIDVPVGDAHACAELRVLGIEAGPTVLADGLEKDIALVVAPSVTLPCERAATSVEAAPPSRRSRTWRRSPPGPFTVTVPIAASYAELTRAMTMAFTDGKLFFSPEYPQLYLETPELYESQGLLVLKLHLAGPIHKLGIDADLDGDLFLSGHLAVVDNELQIPDLEPTIETRNFLLSLKAMSDGDRIRDQARQALRLDIGDRLRPVRVKLSSELTFGSPGGCFHGDVARISVTGIHLHASYLRVYVEVTARARARWSPAAVELPPSSPVAPPP